MFRTISIANKNDDWGWKIAHPVRHILHQAQRPAFDLWQHAQEESISISMNERR